MNDAKLTAMEARSLASGSTMGLNGILSDIENNAKSGLLMMSVPLLRQDVIIELIELGYAVSEHTDANIGVKNNLISWR